MRTVAILSVFALLLPAAARAQEPPAAAQQEALARLLQAQLLRIEALEARLAGLQQEVQQLRTQPLAAAQAPAAAPAPVPKDQNVLVQHAVAGEPPEDAILEGPADDLPRIRSVDAYGSLRVAAALDSDGNREIRNNSSRLGLRGEKKLTDTITAFGRAEVGLNLVANDRVILGGGDPGAPIGQGSQVVWNRLGFVGLGTRIGAFSWGKQWSAYYDVAAFTDQSPIWGGSASGAFAAGTDGGIAGTGRAEKALQYREAKGPVSVALQMQSRATSPNDQAWVDVWGASAVIGRAHGLSVAAAYNEVRDGVANPTPNQPQLGDKAALFGLRYRKGPWYAAGIFSVSEQHEADDLGRRFDGQGFELWLRYHVREHLSIGVGYNDLRPESGHPGDFRLSYGLGTVTYDFGIGSRVFFTLRLEDSRRSDGSEGRNSAFATGLNFTF